MTFCCCPSLAARSGFSRLVVHGSPCRAAAAVGRLKFHLGNIKEATLGSSPAHYAERLVTIRLCVSLQTKTSESDVGLQRAASSARQSAVARSGTRSTPATAPRTVWREETAAPTTRPPAKVADPPPGSPAVPETN